MDPNLQFGWALHVAIFFFLGAINKSSSEKKYGIALAQVNGWSIAHAEIAVTTGHLENMVGTFHYPRQARFVFKKEEDYPQGIGVLSKLLPGRAGYDER